MTEKRNRKQVIKRSQFETWNSQNINYEKKIMNVPKAALRKIEPMADCNSVPAQTSVIHNHNIKNANINS